MTQVLFILYLLLPYALNILFVGFALAFFIQRRGKPFSWFLLVPILFFFFAAIDLYILPLLLQADVTFTVHNQRIASMLNTEENQSLSEFLATDLADLIGWFLQAWLALLFALLVTRSSRDKERQTREMSS